MSISLFSRHTNIFNSIVADTCRKRFARTFRKTLGVYNYKVKQHKYYKNPHAVEFYRKEQLKADGSDFAMRKMKGIERLSTTPYGKITTKGNFLLDTRRIPHYNIPDISDFALKPYVTYKTTSKPQDYQTIHHILNNDYMINIIKPQLYSSNSEDIRNMAKEIFETEEGKKIMEEYFAKQNKKSKLRIVNF
jgi:large subunit ribosomal protein L41